MFAPFRPPFLPFSFLPCNGEDEVRRTVVPPGEDSVARTECKGRGRDARETCQTQLQSEPHVVPRQVARRATGLDWTGWCSTSLRIGHLFLPLT
jgi:hypothetical protein